MVFGRSSLDLNASNCNVFIRKLRSIVYTVGDIHISHSQKKKTRANEFYFKINKVNMFYNDRLRTKLMPLWIRFSVQCAKFSDSIFSFYIRRMALPHSSRFKRFKVIIIFMNIHFILISSKNFHLNEK